MKLLQLFNRAHVKKIKQLFDVADYKLMQVTRLNKENGKTFHAIEDIETHGLLTSNQIMDYFQNDDALLDEPTDKLGKEEQLWLVRVLWVVAG